MKEKVERLLLKCEKPARYTGGEYNQPDVTKPHDVSFCMCFPDVYEVAMSNLGIKILYHALNDCEGIVAERCFTPWVDFAEIMERYDIPLFSLESKKPLKNFDIVGFSMQYELSYSNVLFMLKLSGIPFYAEDRVNGDYPLLIAGGPCMCNPMPVADFFDAIIIGDGEEITLQYTNLYKGVVKGKIAKSEFLAQIAELDGVYVPSLSQKKVRRAVVRDLNTAYYPTKVIVPNIEAVHDRGIIELFRGCTRSCRFCQAGMIYRPVRERKPYVLIEQAKQLIENTGFEELSMNSLSTGDYSALKELILGMHEFNKENRVTMALPSLRLDSFLAEYASVSRKNSLTFAPEAGTQRLRDVINKNITNEDFEQALTDAFGLGYSTVKLYFMIGLPTETYEDLDGIVEMAKMAKSIYSRVARRGALTVTVSCSTFVPKPFTPFQWVAQDDMTTIREKQNYLSGLFKKNRIKFNYHDSKTSIIEAAISRADREFSKCLVKAFEKGAKFDGWSEFFKYEIWTQAIEECGLSLTALTGERDINAEMCWDAVDMGITKQFLQSEYKKAQLGTTTDDCRKGCRGCGMNKLEVGLC